MWALRLLGQIGRCLVSFREFAAPFALLRMCLLLLHFTHIFLLCILISSESSDKSTYEIIDKTVQGHVTEAYTVAD